MNDDDLQAKAFLLPRSSVGTTTYLARQSLTNYFSKTFSRINKSLIHWARDNSIHNDHNLHNIIMIDFNNVDDEK